MVISNVKGRIQQLQDKRHRFLKRYHPKKTYTLFDHVAQNDILCDAWKKVEVVRCEDETARIYKEQKRADKKRGIRSNLERESWCLWRKR